MSIQYMTDVERFQAAIVHHPEDDLPRLVFADYLEETGSFARAEFIRVQCELARLPLNHPDRQVLADRELELLRQHRANWVIQNVRAYQCFERGFVESIRIAGHQLAVIDPSVFRQVPIRELRVQNVENYIDAVINQLSNSRIEHFDLSNHGFGLWIELNRLIEQIPQTRLRKVSLRNNQLWPDSVNVLVESNYAGKLETLDLSGNPIADLGFETLGRATTLTKLRELIIHGDEQHHLDCVSPAGAAAFAAFIQMPELRRLDLRDQYIGDQGLLAVIHSPLAETLVDLDVSYNDVGTTTLGAIESLVESRHFNTLQMLNLSGSFIRVQAAESLANWKQLEIGLRLDLTDCDYEPGAKEILESCSFHEHIDMGDYESSRDEKAIPSSEL